MMQGKPAANVNIAFLLKTNTDMLFVPCDLNRWPSDPKINGFSELMLDHICNKFDGPSCIGFLTYHVEKPTYRRTHECRWSPYPRKCAGFTVWNSFSDFIGDSTRSVPTVSDVYLKRICLLDANASSCWLRGSVSLAGELSLFCARPVVDAWPLMWVNRPL